MTHAIETENLTKTYDGRTNAVDGVSISVGEAEIFGFLGPNGAGKTTTIRMLTTLNSISGGRASVAGHDVAHEQDAVRQSVGLVLQEATVDSGLTGMENLMLSARLYRVHEAEAKARAGELLLLVGLQEAAGRLVRTYSGGMKKRLELITGLIHEPKVLFLDEPTLGLDVQTRTAMWEYIRRINRESRTTIFLTTHYLEEADELCSKVAIIDRGRLLSIGSPQELKSRLGGAVLEIEVATDSDMTGLVASESEHGKVTRSGRMYRVDSPSPQKSLTRVLDAFYERGVQVTTTRLERPSLDKVFLDVTGRTMRQENNSSFGDFAERWHAEGKRE